MRAASFARCVLEASARMLSRAHGPVACDGPDLFIKTYTFPKFCFLGNTLTFLSGEGRLVSVLAG